MATFKATFETGNIFTSGASVKYGPNLLVAEPSTLKRVRASEYSIPLWLRGLELGLRFPSFQVVQQADAKPIQLGERLRSDGRWRVIIFAGDISGKLCFDRLQALGTSLAQADSFMHSYNVKGRGSDFPIEVLVVHAARRQDVELFDLHEAFHPLDMESGWDHYKIFADDESYHSGHGRAYERYGVDKVEGVTVIVRPDQYVAWKGRVDDVEGLNTYFSGVLISGKKDPIG